MNDVDRAVEILLNGGLVAIPTETVYGLAALATDEAAVRRIFAVKGRPADHPLIVHIESAASMASWAETVNPSAATLAAACWPGPLTLLVARGERVPDVITGGRPTVGLRVPAHPLTTELLRRLGTGLAAPSANRFGRVSPTTAAHVLADLGDDVDLILDGGPCPIGVESTIVDTTTQPVQILRPGGIPMDAIDALLGGRLASAAGPSRASGMLDSHYAPNCRVELATTGQEAHRLLAQLTDSGACAGIIDGTDNLVAYAQHLYAWLRDADEQCLDTVIAVLPSAEGLGHAIIDRLRKAAFSPSPAD